MSKNQDQEPIDKIKQQLDAEYKNFTDLESFGQLLGSKPVIQNMMN
ncbi:MAG: hypothetical protein ACRYE8_07290 [Janthinobacterium lividum]